MARSVCSRMLREKNDLKYFLREICRIEYIHLPILAPTQTMLASYRGKDGDWRVYEEEFLGLMRARGVHNAVARDIIADACLLCSEAKPHHCHRRLVAEYLAENWGNVQIVHL